MLLLLVLALSSRNVPALRPASLEPVRVIVTLGEPRVISVESPGGWIAPGSDVTAPVPVSPARFRLTIPASSATGRQAPALGTI